MFLVGIFHSWWFKGAFGWNQTDSKCFSSGLYIGIIYAAHRSEWHHCQGRRQVMVKMDSGLTAVVCPPGVDTAVFLHPAQGRWGKVEEKNQQKGAQRIKPGFQKLLRSYTRKKKRKCLSSTYYDICVMSSGWSGIFRYSLESVGRSAGSICMETHRCWTPPYPQSMVDPTGEKKDLKSGLGVILGAFRVSVIFCYHLRNLIFSDPKIGF